MLFLRIDASGEVVGWQRTPADQPPPPPEGITHQVVDEDDPTVIAALSSARWPQNGPNRWRWEGGLVEVPDPRVVVTVTQTPNPGVVGQPLTIRLTAGRANRTARAVLIDQNGRRRRVALNFTGGVAERVITPVESGELELVSDDTLIFGGDNPIVIDEDW